MTVLRDIRNPEQFKRFAHKLHRSIKPTSLSLQQLQHEIAIALGARSLEAYLIASANDSATIEATKPMVARQDDLLWLQRAQDWYVIAYDDNENKFDDNEPYYLNHNGVGVVTHLSDVVSPSSLVVTTLAEAERFIKRSTHTLAAKSRVALFSDEFPILFAYMQMDLKTLQKKLPKNKHYSDFPYEGFSEADWKHEVSNDDTVRSYAEWFLSQLEQAVDDIGLTLKGIQFNTTS